MPLRKAVAAQGTLAVDTDWWVFIIFVTGCVYSWAALSSSPRKKTYRAIAVILLLLLYFLAKFGLI